MTLDFKCIVFFQSSNTQLAFELETKLMERQEKQRKETEEHFRNQAEMSETLQKRLEEQAARHMEVIIVTILLPI